MNAEMAVPRYKNYIYNHVKITPWKWEIIASRRYFNDTLVVKICDGSWNKNRKDDEAQFH